MSGLIKVLNATYGPYAFGVVAVLIVWFAVVAPEQRQNKIDFKAQQEVVQQLKDQSAQNERAANVMKDTSTIQERVVDGMNRALDRIERLK